MQRDFLAKQKHCRKLTRLKNRPLTVLARNNKTDLERLPSPVNTLTERATEHMLLPRVQMQARNSRQIHRIITSRGEIQRGHVYTRSLRPHQLSCLSHRASPPP